MKISGNKAVSCRHLGTLATILIILTLLGCNRHGVPRGLPEPEKMAEIITDILILESTITYIPELSAKIEGNPAGQYRHVLHRHGLTPEEFDSIRNWYNSNPELYQLVYEKVISRLSEREAEVRVLIEREKIEQARLEAIQEQAIREEFDLWTGSDSKTISPGDTTDARLPFRFVTDTLNLSGTITLSASYRFLTDDTSRSPRMVLSATYGDGLADTVYKAIPHSFNRHAAVLELKLKNDTLPIAISGYLLYQDMSARPAVEITDISLRRLPVADSQAELQQQAGYKEPVTR